jgi:hypothetical protein
MRKENPDGSEPRISADEFQSVARLVANYPGLKVHVVAPRGHGLAQQAHRAATEAGISVSLEITTDRIAARFGAAPAGGQ